MNRTWWRAAGIRAIKTAAETAIACIGTTAMLTAVDWPVVAGTTALATILSLLASIKGLPEVSSDE